MRVLDDNNVDASIVTSPSRPGDATLTPPPSHFAACPRQDAPMRSRCETWDSRSERWGRLMVATQAGERRCYEQLLRELDIWLRRYYARRLPPSAADDARQDSLLAIHAKRHTYAPSKPFGAWVTAIARDKWIDRIRDASRFTALALGDEMPIEDHEEAAISAASLDDLLRRLKPAHRLDQPSPSFSPRGCRYRPPDLE